MPITESDKLTLQRFGCTLHTSQDLLHVSWADLSGEQALAATVLVRSTHRKCLSGPALCLALEISPTRALPRYCYFLFDLQDAAQMGYLDRLSARNRLPINFLCRDFELVRNHELTSSESGELKRSCANAQVGLSTTDVPYSVTTITEQFEASVRIPQLFERAISEAEFAKALPLLMKDLEKISSEKRALARELVCGVANALRPRWGEQLKKGIGDLPHVRLSLALLLDLQRIFGDDYEGFLDFFAGAVAHGTEEEVLAELKKWLPNLESIFKLVELANSAPQAKRGMALRNLGEAVLNVLRLLRRGRELSLSMLKTLLLPLKPLLLSQPGRPTKDYSREYELKESGLSWSQVTRQSLLENADIREEFGGRNFDSLTGEQRQAVGSRIREGVRSYAERMGKPFPIERPDKERPQRID